MGEDERERERDDDERPEGGPGRHSDPHDAGEPLSEGGTTTGTSSGAPGEHEDPDAGGPNPTPRREQPGL